MKPIIVIGGGGHAKVLVEALMKEKAEMIGITDCNVKLEHHHILGISIIGNDEMVFNYHPDQIDLVNGIGSISTKSLAKRKEIYDYFKEKGYTFAKVLHPSAVIAEDVKLAEGVQVMAGAVIQSGTLIGENVIVNTRASLDHDCVVNEHTHIAPGVTISGGVHIEKEVHLGTGANVIQNIYIGEKSLIGAGALVTKNIPAFSKAMGVPVRIERI